MKDSMYQKILKVGGDTDKAKRNKLLRIYLHIPSLPNLRAIRTLLVELKETSKRKNGGNSRLSRRT